MVLLIGGVPGAVAADHDIAHSHLACTQEPTTHFQRWMDSSSRSRLGQCPVDRCCEHPDTMHCLFMLFYVHTNKRCPLPMIKPNETGLFASVAWTSPMQPRFSPGITSQPKIADTSTASRFVTLGSLNERMVVMVWTQRGEDRRIISMRKANEREQERYRSRLG
ncbi:BrnT family toxin [Pseudomonas sp. HR96]|uniref:BrnT family toxin n=1 Tax=Pseudomonas sp. HR96 TaxID=1027966 RepID=UPI002A747A37|nr:BrnT family toxin [Pseudomonas sp. HR96]WPO97961.1 BrnT family toxin [Pseudomonas sp. HR96]